jgi:hypothetical protein
MPTDYEVSLYRDVVIAAHRDIVHALNMLVDPSCADHHGSTTHSNSKMMSALLLLAFTFLSTGTDA